MDKLEGLKLAISLITSIGVGAIVENVIKATTPPKIGKINKFCIMVGSIVLTGMISSMASKHVEVAIESGAETVKDWSLDEKDQMEESA